MLQRSLIMRAVTVWPALAIAFFLHGAQAAVAQTCTPPPAGMAAWYPADGNYNDIVGGNNAAPLPGPAPQFVAGKVAQGLSLSGPDGAVAPASSGLDVGTTGPGLTIDAWVNPTASGPLVEYHTGSAIGVHLWLYDTSNSLSPSPTRLYANIVGINGASHMISSTPGAITSGTFQHVAVTYDRVTGLAVLYVNGNNVGQANLGTFTPQTSYNLYLGQRPNDTTFSSFAGVLDEVEIFNRALTQAELQAIVTADAGGKCKPAHAASQLIISEMSPRGPLGLLDEFVEVYNGTDSDHTVAAPDASGGYAVVAEDGVPRCIIPNGTVIPARRHFLCAGAQYSYSSEVTADSYFVIAPSNFGDIGDQQGVALFSTSNAANFNAGTRLDAFGYTTSPPLYREGAGFPFASVVNTPHSYPRTQYAGYERDTGNNASDFISVNSRLDVCCDPNSSLGMPGPQNLASPVVRLGVMPVTLFDPNVAPSVAPNRVTNVPPGTLRFRRTITNNMAQPVTRLRVRVVDITTLNTPTTAQDGKPTPCFAPCVDLRVLSSSDEQNVPTSQGPRPTSGTTLEFNGFQPIGGGYNSSLNVNQVSAGAQMLPNASLSINMLVGIQPGGTARFFFFVEALP